MYRLTFIFWNSLECEDVIIEHARYVFIPYVVVKPEHHEEIGFCELYL